MSTTPGRHVARQAMIDDAERAGQVLAGHQGSEPGWYPDWNGELRWWDGVWADRVREPGEGEL